MSVQVPGGEIRIDEGCVELVCGESIEDLFARLVTDDSVLRVRQGHRPADNADPFSDQVGEGTNALCVTRHYQAELSPGIRHAPGDVLGRSLVERMAEDDIAALFAQTIARAEGTGAPVDLERPAEFLAHQPGHGDIESLRRAVCRLARPRHGRWLGAEGQRLWFVF